MLIAAQKNGVVCIAKNKLSKGTNEEVKILTIGDSYFGIHAKANTCQAVEQHFQEREGPIILNSSEEIFAELLPLLVALKKAGSPPIALNALVVNPFGIFNVSSIVSVIECERFYAIGHRYKRALGAMEMLYNRESSSEEIVRRASVITAHPDTESGTIEEMYLMEQKERELREVERGAV